ncbi:MAG: lipopolysaccharide biosynthesis protein [Pseudomonas sp.]|uniref:lipopolysaccharide biosynthesis protein n=1 Tax=Pseudomonas sp. TaxID=306 RepID=UPI0033919985
MLEIRSLRDLLRLFFLYRTEFKYAVMATLLVVILGAFLLPTRYESNARLLVKAGRENATLPIEVSNRQALIAPSTQRDPIVDEEKMLTGRPIVRWVAERYLERVAAYRPQGFWQGLKFQLKRGTGAVLEVARQLAEGLGLVEAQTEVERLAKRLEKNFSVSHEAGSSVMEVSFTWDDPVIAQQVLETWVEAYLQERTRALSRKSLYAFYEGETQKVSTQILALKKTLQGRLAKIDSISVEERLANLTQQINRLNDARSETLNELAGLRSFLLDARSQLKRQPLEVVSEREVSLNPNQLDLKLKLNGLKLERSRLLGTFLPDAGPVKQLDRNIQSLQALIDQESQRLERSQNLTPNSLAVSLRQQTLDAELRERQLQGQLQEHQQQLAQLRGERTRVLNDEPGLSRTSLQLQAAEQSFALYTDSLEKARIDRELDSSQISNIAQIEQATFNPSRVFPKSLNLLLLALPLSLAVGLLVLYLCYLLDQRVHDGARVEARFKVPLWTTLPDLGTSPNRTSQAFTAALYRLYGQLPLEQLARDGLTLGLSSARPGEGVSFVLMHLRRLLEARGHRVRLDAPAPAAPGEVVLLDAAALLTREDALLQLRRADLIVLVVEAQRSTVPMVEHSLAILTMAFKRVDGLILNRRRFDIPEALLQRLSRWRGAH